MAKGKLLPIYVICIIVLLLYYSFILPSYIKANLSISGEYVWAGFTFHLHCKCFTVVQHFSTVIAHEQNNIKTCSSSPTLPSLSGSVPSNESLLRGF